MEHGPADMFTSGFVLLAAALFFVLIFRRFGLGAVLGYLVAGALIGPEVLGLVDDPETIVGFAEIGIILLLFLVGLELAPSQLWRMKRDIFGLGMSQVILCGIALFAAIYLITNFTWQAALVIGLPLALSSTAQVLPLLKSEGRLNTPAGQKAFSILLFQDLSIVPLLTIVAALSRAPVEGEQTAGWLLALYSALAVVGLVLAGRYLLAPLLKLIGQVAERELFIVVGLFAVFGSAALMHHLGLSPALGAFVAGVMLADSPFRHELEADIDPFRSILLGLFFMGVGMMLDLSVIWENPLFVIGMAVLLIAIKIGIIFGLGKAFGMQTAPAFVLGLLLSQGGEFGFVLFAAAEAALLIEGQASSLFGAVITLSMATTPFLMLLAKRLGGVKSSIRSDMDDPEEAPRSSAIVIGHGRFGQAVSQICAGADISVTLIDSNPDQIDTSSEYGRKVFYGDGTRVDLLRRAGAEEACMLLFCLDDREFGPEQLAPISTSFPNAMIYVRAFDRMHLLRLKGTKIDGAQRELMESAIKMSADALIKYGLDKSKVEALVSEFRYRDLQRLEMQHEAGDMKAGMHMTFGGDMSEGFDMDDFERGKAEPGNTER